MTKQEWEYKEFFDYLSRHLSVKKYSKASQLFHKSRDKEFLRLKKVLFGDGKQ